MTETQISKPALLVDLPEVTVDKSEFIYNYFMADERVNETANQDGSSSFRTIEQSNSTSTSMSTMALGTTSITDARTNSYYGSNYKYPRFIKVSFTKPRVNIYEGERVTLDDERIAREAALNVFGRLGVSIVDTSLDKTIYSLLSGSIATTSNDTTQTATQQLITAITDSIQPDGYRYASSDSRAQVTNSIERTLRGIEFGVSYDAKYAGTITKRSLDSSKNVYVDELTVTTQTLLDQQEIAINNSNPYVLRTADYETNFVSSDIPEIEMSVPDASAYGSSDTSSNTLRNFVVGYIVQKISTAEDGTNVISEKLITSPYATAFLDADVAYGKEYRYKIITIYACQFQIMEQILTESGSAVDDRIIVRYVLFASRGTSVAVICEENIAPPPPVDLKFRYRADNTGLNITWNFPVNLQRDIKKFQVFRRRSTSESFQLIAVYDFDDSVVKSADPEQVPERLIRRSILPTTLHRDTSFDKNSRFIYAICAIDAHGLTSNYSVQLEASYDRYRNKINTRVISRSDAPKPYPNIFLNRDTFVDTMKMSGYTKLSIYFDPEVLTVTDDAGNDLQHILINRDADDNYYKLMIVNTDLQQSQVLDVKINKTYTTPPVITPSTARVFVPT